MAFAVRKMALGFSFIPSAWRVGTSAVDSIVCGIPRSQAGISLNVTRGYRKLGHPIYATEARFKSPDPKVHHFKKILLPPLEEQREPIPILHAMYRRSFARKDYGHKPKPRLDVNPWKWTPVDEDGHKIEKGLDKYSPKPFQVVRTGGRHPLTGRVIYRRIGGGVKPTFFFLDTTREYIPDSETPIVEKVLQVRETPNLRSAHIAKLGYEDSYRWVIATENMKPGQLVKSSRAVGRLPVRAFEGDTYAVGALPVGTVLSSVERVEGDGAKVARAAGCCATIIKKEEGSVIIQMPSKQTIRVSEKCIATVGRASNVGWQDIDWGSAGAMRRRGIRPKSGLWHRKDGYCGRKIKAAKPLRSYLTPPAEKPASYSFTHKF
ncbi:39S ribosomal protein L2, mitochondrial-like [Paramacrobiotus metropolitanus]|uniref:39S ribosomal protein L2, mitochondrial-like n=1 Tax=Paramacrobiotus metropolitanus TaxID=2943436 RepID=UPI00244569EB|nr:39S ribosomal protein L2, mitochondrial-like [Paramacrobiotus metropolitanus]